MHSRVFEETTRCLLWGFVVSLQSGVVSKCGIVGPLRLRYRALQVSPASGALTLWTESFGDCGCQPRISVQKGAVRTGMRFRGISCRNVWGTMTHDSSADCKDSSAAAEQEMGRSWWLLELGF